MPSIFQIEADKLYGHLCTPTIWILEKSQHKQTVRRCRSWSFGLLLVCEALLGQRRLHCSTTHPTPARVNNHRIQLLVVTLKKITHVRVSSDQRRIDKPIEEIMISAHFWTKSPRVRVFSFSSNNRSSFTSSSSAEKSLHSANWDSCIICFASFTQATAKTTTVSWKTTNYVHFTHMQGWRPFDELILHES